MDKILHWFRAPIARQIAAWAFVMSIVTVPILGTCYNSAHELGTAVWQAGASMMALSFAASPFLLSVLFVVWPRSSNVDHPGLRDATFLFAGASLAFSCGAAIVFVWYVASVFFFPELS